MPVESFARAAAAALWSVSLTFHCLGLIEGRAALNFYAWGVFLGLVAIVPTGWLVVGYLNERALARFRAALAEAVGSAVGNELEHQREAAGVSPIR